jgi:hypothetical protein
MSCSTSKTIRLCSLAFAVSMLGAFPAMAQTTGGAATAPTTAGDPAVSTQRTDDREDDKDWGWVGLLGLAGLLGLRRREHVHHVDTTPAARTTGARV